MPSINRIRVNNVKYNFGTQSYDDFSMRMYGRNTLYDLANGGGKSVLMLLLMQNLIPNCTLDDKQPIEKLFRDSSNTVIHSLIEWKLDSCDIKEGMRYMTTGFAARKAATTEEERKDGTAQIEYFNYVIFYREYNKNDILNLPLVKDNERISYKALRNYLHDLARNDKNMIVQVFDRKGEYQRFIAQYGLYESHWEIIRGINKTEGHVRTYFESNYKTTRRVIEDLLIEEIIEKAYQTKTERESDKTESTVSLLMTIQEELKSLAEKKKGIQLYDHEQELVQLLIDRIESFMELYKNQERTAETIGRVLVTLENEKSSRQEKLDKLQGDADELEEKLRDVKELIEVLKIYMDIEELAARNELISGKEAAIKSLSQDIDLQDKAFRQRSAISEYLELKKATQELEALSKEKKDVPKGADDIYTIVANIRDRFDKKLEEIDKRLSPLTQALAETKEKSDLLMKQKAEGETELAVIGSRQEYLSKDIDELNKEMNTLQDDIDYSLLMDPRGSVSSRSKALEECEAKTEELVLKKERLEFDIATLEKELDEKVAEDRANEIRLDELRERVEEYKKCSGKYTSICSIYADEKNVQPNVLEEKLRDRLSASVIKVYELQGIISELEKRDKDIRGGRLVEATKGVEKVIDYLFTRHSISAMYGMDFLSALPDKKKEEVLDKAPGIAFGVIVDDLSVVLEDPGLKELDIDEEVYIYDKAQLGGVSLLLGDGVECVRRNKEYFLDPKFQDAKLRLLGSEIDNQQEELKNNEAMLETLKEDMDFVKLFREKGYSTAEQDFKAAEENKKSAAEEISKLRETNQKLADNLESTTNELEELRKNIERYQAELISLTNLVSLQDRVNELTRRKEDLKNDKKQIEARIEEVSNSKRSNELRILEQEAQIETLNKEKDELNYKWDNKYSVYYIDTTAFPPLDLDEPELESAFERALGGSGDSRISLEKEKLLQDTLKGTIERQTRAIERLGVDVADLAELDRSGSLTAVSDEVLDAMRSELDNLQGERRKLEQDMSGISTEKARLEGSIEYAKQRLEMEYGGGALSRLENPGEEYIQDTRKSLDELKGTSVQYKAMLDKAKAELDKAASSAKNNDDLMKLANRIVDTAGVDISELSAFDSTANIDEEFDSYVMKYDKLSKDIDRARADMMKVKMSVYDTLMNLGVLELAASIRDDVNIPENRRDAERLLKRLGDVIEIIILERDRVEKSLVSMQQLKDNFVDQCVERCLDVRSELDKLTKLSEITMGDSKVQMIRLSIPYVKDEFIKDRMSEYIDNVVEEVDKKNDDGDRQKFLSTSLSMKKLFSVIVTDMSKIRLMLYKRERIKEQSRYLRYEEAVGSTGQSQGIYIQFLISIINYIAGMYAVQDTARSKTLFIDNPFGAAKDIYIWEPIFKLLEENSCQLIVPARGATPEITGKFDINYVLGQQMTGNKTTTVVVNYSSKTKGEELEYKNLDYEQATFDFV